MSTSRKPSPERYARVGKISKDRMRDLGMNQKQLAEKSGVSLAIVREIIHNTELRDRNTRTLEALSVALKFHPQHLWALNRGEDPPPADPDPNDLVRLLASIESKLEPIGSIEDRLAAIEDQLTQMWTRLFRVDGGWPYPDGTGK